MTHEYSISIDWHEEFNKDYEKWDNHGARLARDKELEKLENCPHGNADQGYCDECECYPDDRERELEPMMNYAYPLHHEPSEEEILEITEETSCTVMENTHTGDFFLVLTGGGMDLSQSIAHAYLICGYIPDSLAFNVSTQYGLNISGETYFKVMKAIKESLQDTITDYTAKIKRINEAIEKAKGDKK